MEKIVKMKMKDEEDQRRRGEDRTEKLRALMARRKVAIKQWNVDHFFKIIDEQLEDFMEYDRCYKLADKYLISMVFMYFLRASFLPEEYTRFNFFVALYLAHDMEEDNEDTRAELLIWSPADDDAPAAAAGGARDIWTPSFLLNQREQLFKRIDCRAVVSRACCEALMHIVKPQHPVWQRQRHSVHAGANPRNHRIRNVCPNCIGCIGSPDST